MTAPRGLSGATFAGVPPGVARRIDDLDRVVDEVFDRWRGHPMADRLFYGASALGDHGLLWLMLCAARGMRSERDLRFALRAAVAVGIESAVVNVGIKALFQRRRPESAGQRPLPLRLPRTSSFPSGHATSAFCAAGLLSEEDPLRPLYYAAALIVAWSRVYVRIHHASDVIGGMAIGVAFGRLGRRLAPLSSPRRGVAESQTASAG